MLNGPLEFLKGRKGIRSTRKSKPMACRISARMLIWTHFEEVMKAGLLLGFIKPLACLLQRRSYSNRRQHFRKKHYSRFSTSHHGSNLKRKTLGELGIH